MDERPQVRIEYDVEADLYVVSDEDGEFARSNMANGCWPYVADLLMGDGTHDVGGLRDRTIRALAG